jgi:hypothetical protein
MRANLRKRKETKEAQAKLYNDKVIYLKGHGHAGNGLCRYILMIRYY